MTLDAAPDAPPLMERKLFGGAITCRMPSHYVDVSEMRQVPDNQEVFVEMTSPPADADDTLPLLDHSLVVEVVEMAGVEQVAELVDEPDCREARFHFRSLAHDNDATNDCQIIHCERVSADLLPGISPEIQVSLVYGTQCVVKFRRGTSGTELPESTAFSRPILKDVVVIYLVLLRLPHCSTDVVVTLNQPVAVNCANVVDHVDAVTAAIKLAIAGPTVDLHSPLTTRVHHGIKLIRQGIIDSLRFADLSVFGDVGKNTS